MKLTLVDGLEAGLLTVVEAGGELNLRNRALAEIADARAARSGGRGSSDVSRSGGSRGRSGRGRASGRASNDVALVVDSGDSGEVSLDAKDSVESISLSTRSGRGFVCSA